MVLDPSKFDDKIKFDPDYCLCDQCMHGFGDYCAVLPDTLTDKQSCPSFDDGENYGLTPEDYTVKLEPREFTLQDLGGAIKVVKDG